MFEKSYVFDFKTNLIFYYCRFSNMFCNTSILWQRIENDVIGIPFFSNKVKYSYHFQ